MHQSFLFDINQFEGITRQCDKLPEQAQATDDKPKKGKECPQCKKLVGCRSNTCEYCSWNFSKIKKKRSKGRTLNEWGVPTRTKAEKIESRHRWIDNYKLGKGCKKCGYNRHPSALCFNHLPEYRSEKNIMIKNGGSKKINKGSMNAGGMFRLYDPEYCSIKDLIAEIRKCEILCANCHQEETYPDNPRYIKRKLLMEKNEFN
jgi:hypothetical protein